MNQTITEIDTIATEAELVSGLVSFPGLDWNNAKGGRRGLLLLPTGWAVDYGSC